MIETNDLPVKGDTAFNLFRKNVIKNHFTSVDDPLEMHGAKRRRWERVKDNCKEGFSLNTSISERQKDSTGFVENVTTKITNDCEWFWAIYATSNVMQNVLDAASFFTSSTILCVPSCVDATFSGFLPPCIGNDKLPN